MMRRVVHVLLVVLLVVSSVCVIDADTAANCFYDDVVGEWNLTLGVSGYDNTIDCQGSFVSARNYLVTLSYPNLAKDEDGNNGTWTMIYNQGFEIRMDSATPPVVYFAFSAFDAPAGQTWAISYCGLTSTGWYHDDNTQGTSNWGCVSMSKTTPVPPRNSTIPTDTAVAFDDMTYVEDPMFVHQINSVQKLWKAKVYPEMHGQTLSQIHARAGAPKHGNVVMQKWEKLPEAPLKQVTTHLPESWDWRDVNGSNFVSPVRDQGACGSCYIFSSMGMLESRIRIYSKNRKQPILSTQQPLVCSQYSQGCNGGFPYLIAGKFAHDFAVLEDSCMPYDPTGPAKCSYTPCNGTKLWTATNQYTYVGGYYGATTAELIQQEIKQSGPVSVSFEVYPDFQLYAGGIYTHKPIADANIQGFNPFYITNHAVLAVGWGVENGVKYWTIKNSWGPAWGENGYFRILREAGPGGECSIESLVVSSVPHTLQA